MGLERGGERRRGERKRGMEICDLERIEGWSGYDLTGREWRMRGF